MTSEHRFGTAINCIDGRVQQPVADWVRKNYGVDYVDMVNEPGPDKVLSQVRTLLIDSLKDKVSISINAHHSRVVVIAGHHDCAANPVSRDEHEAQIRSAVKEIASLKLPVTIAGLWIDSDWKANSLVIVPPQVILGRDLPLPRLHLAD